MSILNQLKNLKDGEILTIKHEIITSLVINISKYYKVYDFLGIPTKMYNDNFIIEDSDNRIRPFHDLELGLNDMNEYVLDLLSCDSISDFNYTRSLKEKGVKIGDMIKFEDGKKGVICERDKDHTHRNLLYKPLRKNGEISKVKPRMIYGGVKYEKVSEF